MLLQSFGALAVASSLLPLATFATPIRSSLPSLETRQNNYHVVQGIQQGGVKPRLNIRDLESKTENRDMWTLYILALQRLQAQDQQDKLSYYQIAGIHGAPYYEWDGVGPGWRDPDNIHGYCPHFGNLFPTWHRPYILLWEQLLHEHMVAIVNAISDSTTKSRFQTAATNFRTPYWDWAAAPPAGEHVLPSSVYRDTLSVTYPNGTTATITNPLRAYVFHPLIPQDFEAASSYAPYDHWPKTLYNPTPDDSLTPTENITKLHAALDGYQPTAKDRIWNLFRIWAPFNRFATSQAWGGNTLEDIHNTIHSSFDAGHMSPVAFSAFDPIFWLHHAGVDRQFALWQALYPDTWIEERSESRQTTFMYSGGTIPSGKDTPLYPFHKNAAGDFWTSDDCRQTTDLGYTYPELADSPSNETLISRLSSLYEVSAPAMLVSEPQGGTQEKAVRQYIARVTIPAGYNAHLFLGEPGSAPAEWRHEEKFAGLFSTMSSVGLVSNDEILGGQVDLSRQIAKAYENKELKSADEKDIVDFVKKNLNWRVATAGYKEIAAEEVKGFSIEINSQLESLPLAENEMSELLEEKKYGKVTET